jgi:hypothetical protein
MVLELPTVLYRLVAVFVHRRIVAAHGVQENCTASEQC